MSSTSPDEDLLECPNCAELIQAKAIICRFCQSGLSDEHFVECPMCGEMIRREAVLCRFCQSNLAGLKQQTSVPLVITKHGKPLARLSPSQSIAQRRDRVRDFVTGSGSYGAGVRAQVFEVIVRQAIAGAEWRELCAGPMSVNGITVEEIEQELRERGHPGL